MAKWATMSILTMVQSREESVGHEISKELNKDKISAEIFLLDWI